MGEFDLIARHFMRPQREAPRASLVALGIGDDCALLQPRPGTHIAISSDMLVEGRHFLPTVDPTALGHKALAVNLSDLAACGAKPLAFTLALALPSADDAWLAGFAQGLFALADAHGCELVGGDTTRGPLNICITVFGEVPLDGDTQGGKPGGTTQALLRSGAQPGDDLYASGNLGDARLALEALLGSRTLPADVMARARQRLERPTPRVALGQALRGVATSAIDLSDGLLGDLGHVLKASRVGAEVKIDDAINTIAEYAYLMLENYQNDQENLKTTLYSLALAGGDDYELAFTAPPAQRAAVIQAAQASQTVVTRIGRITAEPGLTLVDAQGRAVANTFASFDHFQGAAP
jgi:thiamine-monophosphate kinase